MIHVLYTASFLFVPFQKLLPTHIILLITFSFFVSICLSILYFDTKNTFNDAFKASMLATLAVQTCYLYVVQVVQFDVNKPLHALAFLSFFGLLFSLDSVTKLGKEKASIAAIACLCSLWLMDTMLKHGVVEGLIGKM